MSKTNSLHYQLCELGGKYLKSRKNAEPWRIPNKYVAVELVAAGAEDPDVWATNGYDTSLIEVKTSHADFLADRKKWVRTPAAELADKQLGNYRYYLYPEGIIKEEELPEGWGLLVWDGKKIRKVKPATYVKSSGPMELLMLTSILSRLAKPQVFNFRKKKEETK